MHVTKQVLQTFEIVSPHCVQGGQKIFNGVTEPLDSNAQVVKSAVASIAQRRCVQRMCLLPTFQCQMRKDGTVERDPNSALGQFVSPLLPLLKIKTIERCRGRLFLL